MKKNDARAESALKHVPEWNGEGWEGIKAPERDMITILDSLVVNVQKEIDSKDSTIKKLTEYLRTMVYYHHHPDRKNWDLIGEAEELVKVVEEGIYGDEGGEQNG